MKLRILFLLLLSVFLCGCTPATRLPDSTPGAATEGLSVEEQLAQVDQLLGQSMRASFAYNAPESMQLDQTTTVRLLLNPSASPEQLATQVVNEAGSAVSGSLEITARMKAELIAQDGSAFEIKALHDNAEQLVGGTDTTKWEWWVTARKEGQQHLTLVIYRLVRFDGQDYWREVESYQSDIVIKVTLVQRLRANEGWIAGVVAAAVIVAVVMAAVVMAVFWLWAGRRKRKIQGVGGGDSNQVTNIYVGHDVSGNLIVGDENDTKQSSK